MSIGLQQYSPTPPRSAASSTSVQGSRIVPLLGTVVVLVFCTLDLMDWYFVDTDPTGTDTIGDPRRLIPHIGRALLILLMSGIVVSYWKRPRRYWLFWAQFIWLFVIVLRYVLVGAFDAQAILQCAIYAMAPLALWTFYILARTKQLTQPFVTLAGAAMATIYGVRILLYHLTGVFLGSGTSEDVVIGAIKLSGYEILLFLPLLLLGRQSLLKLWFTVFALLVAALCMERSTQIEVILGFLVLFFSYMKTQPRQRKWVLTIGLLALVLFAVVYALNAKSISQRWSDVTQGEDAGSGRVNFWGILLSNWWHGGTFAHLFGFGPNSVFEATKAAWLAGLVHAHNEWLQTLYETGVLGLIVYTTIIFLLCRIATSLVKMKAPTAPAVLFVITVIVCRSLFDYVLSGSSAVWFCIVIGIAMGCSSPVVPKSATRQRT